MRWTDERKAELRRVWIEERGSFTRVGRRLGVSRASIDGISRRMNLQIPHAPVARPQISAGHPAVVAGRSIFPTRLRDPVETLLKPGEFSRKLGSVVAKGAWRDMPIFSLTLEERATCPRSCLQWRGCFGNHMQAATRYRHGPALEATLGDELAAMQRRHPRGFVLRLHVLGDFYSVDYVARWAAWLRAFPALHVFGYTAWQRGTPIGDAVARLRDRRWDRFAIRTSGAATGPRTSVIDGAGADGVVCPAQTGRTASCGSCALCWSPAARTLPIAFERH